jgi:uncharacterized membrane protein YqjE
MPSAGGERPDPLAAVGVGEGGAGQNIAGSITDISERVLLLVHEEVELAKAEVEEKISRLVRGLVVGFAAGIFIVGALAIGMNGLAWLAWWALPVSYNEFFWGFFLVAAGLLVLAALAGWIAARAMRAGSPPVPSMALEEARRIRESVSAGTTESLPGWDPVAGPEPPAAPIPAAGAQRTEKADGTTDAN